MNVAYQTVRLGESDDGQPTVHERDHAAVAFDRNRYEDRVGRRTEQAEKRSRDGTSPFGTWERTDSEKCCVTVDLGVECRHELGDVPFFFAGSLFPITALPGFLTDFARILPLTHALALMRYGLLHNATGLHDIWGMTNASVMAALSLTVVSAFATALTFVAVRTFTRMAVR